VRIGPGQVEVELVGVGFGHIPHSAALQLNVEAIWRSRPRIPGFHARLVALNRRPLVPETISIDFCNLLNGRQKTLQPYQVQPVHFPRKPYKTSHFVGRVVGWK
jgi:hypothetical protein